VVNVRRANGLIAKDSGGTSDPYCCVTIGKEKQKTQKIMKNLNPQWNEELKFSTLIFEQNITFQLFDWDRFGSDDPLGSCFIEAWKVILNPNQDWTFPLTGGDAKGTLTVNIGVAAPLVAQLKARAEAVVQARFIS
jgi:Ca2+-dependent lipid-binding protein